MFYKSPDYNTSNILLVDGYVPPTSEVEKILSNEGDSPYAASPYNAVNATLINNYSPPSSANHLTILSTAGAGVPSTQSLVVPSVLDGEKFGASKIILKYQLLGHHNNVLAISEKYLQANNYIPTLNLPVQLREYGDFSFVPMPSVQHFHRRIHALGIAKSDVSVPHIHNNSAIVRPSGFNSAIVTGNTTIVNRNRPYEIPGFVASLFGVTRIYNLKQYVSMNGRAVDTSRFGELLLQGGMRFLYVSGFNASIIGQLDALNTKETRTISLSGRAIQAPEIPLPNVSPRIIYVQTFVATQFGNTIVQFPPRPNGFIASTYGTPWVSRSPRLYNALGFESFISGYSKVFDPTQKIYVTGVNTVITGGVFGDISAKNTRRIITVSGLYSQSFSDWSIVESNLRNIIHSGFDAQSFGSNAIQNKTPSIAPIGIYSFDGLNSAIGYRIRTIKPSGWYQPKLGNHTLTKTPELKPGGLNQSAFGSTWVSNKTRSIYAGLGRESLLFGGITVWHFARYLKPTGIFNDGYGAPRVEHGRRTILANGSIHSVYGGSALVSYAVRSLSPSSITYPNIPIHRVGGTQHIQPFGYIATLFGSRIIPESQSIHPQGFINPFGLTIVDLWKKYIKPNGFLTTGQEGGHRFGTHKFWNLRQYVEMYYDVDSGLTPPKWTGWTSVENKNKTIGAIGSNSARISEPNIENKARVLSPVGLNASTFSKSMIADRVRRLKLQGMEAPYISGWSVIYNASPVVAQKGFKADTFGIGTILNTRRYFNRIGNFESLEVGKPMVADRIRTLKFEQRYTIAPPYIPIHSVHLYTRYIEEVGRFDDHQAFGNPSLSIHWNIITPRWTMRDAYGYPTLKNVTPELVTHGRNSEEFGQSSIRTQWRELLQQGSETVLWGGSEIAFRDRQLSVNGFTQWNVPRPKVTKTGVPPYYPQYIWLDAVEIDGEQQNGYGIGLPNNQVPVPNIKTNVIFPDSFIASRYGSHHTQSNGILVQPGLQELTIGNHFVGLKNRTIQVPTLGDFGTGIEETRPSISPHTIYAVVEAPEQARRNHSPSDTHVVDGRSGKGFGYITVTLKHRKFSAGLGNQSDFSNGHKIQLRKRYINLNDFGFRSQRIGFHVVGPFDQDIVQFDSNDMQNFGQPSIIIPYSGAFFIKPNGLTSPAFNKPVIDFFNRTIKTVGSNHLQMGTKKSGDTPFMWQGLRIGELIKGNYGGFENEAFGNTFISLKVRNVGVQSFESFVMEYDYTQFDKRMRVVRQELPKQKLFIESIGFVSSSYGVPNTKPAAHYIRPDGNADQFRKGAF